MANRILGRGLIEGEGPVALADGSVWVVEMARERACITRVGPDGSVDIRIKTGGRPTGMALDGDGRLWITEGREGSVDCYEQDGRLVTSIRPSNGRFIWPNDLCFGPDGHLYLTDSGILDTDFVTGIAIVPHYRTLPYDGCLYELDPVAGTVVRRFDGGIKFTNGIAFGPDKLLYANETLGGDVFRYDVFGSATPRREFFGNVVKAEGPAGWRGPDGMAFGDDGRLYCTVYGQGDITVLGRDGKVEDRLATNDLRPTNIAFARSGKQAFVTEVLQSVVEVLEMPCEGLPLYAPSLAL